MPQDTRFLEFVYLALFDRTSKGVVTMEEMRQVETDLLENPLKGAVEEGTSGVRKVRAAIGSKGKSGGARVVYLYVPRRGKIYFIIAFLKNVQASLSKAQKKLIRQLVRELEQER
ncbi:MAG: type II toxin-antitoxin system RelE/ParE family toxin [Gemmatimonadota bacterium]